MLRGVYTAASGMLVQQGRTDVISNNLANVDTAGFQKQTALLRAFPEMLLLREHRHEKTPIGFMGTGALVDDSRFSFLPGRLQQTNNPLDVALHGFGFFLVDVAGEPRYTRDGRFALDNVGYLVTLEGHRVRGEDGPIFVGDGAVTIESDGTVLVEGQQRGRLLVVEFLDREVLSKVGGNLYEAAPDADPAFRYPGVVVQGAVEMPNVNVIKEMVSLIEVQRSYEANQKVVQAYDETLGKAVNEIAG